jgi:hypothetical protein
MLLGKAEKSDTARPLCETERFSGENVGRQPRKLARSIRQSLVGETATKIKSGLRLDSCPGSDFKVKTVESKGVPHLEAWEYRAFKEQLKLVNGFER